MPRTCTVCGHDERHEIDVALVRREPYRHIASRCGVSTGALQRHVNRGHIAERLRKAKDEEDVRAALDVTRQLRAINSVAADILKEARDHSDPVTALRAIDRIHKQLELQAKLLGDLDERPVNVLISPEWIELRAVIVGALEPYTDARGAVLQAIEGAGNGSA